MLRGGFPYWPAIVKVWLSSGYRSSRMMMFTVADVSFGWSVIMAGTVKSSLQSTGIANKY